MIHVFPPSFLDYFSSFILVTYLIIIIIITIIIIIIIIIMLVANYLSKSSYSHDIFLNSIITVN